MVLQHGTVFAFGRNNNALGIGQKKGISEFRISARILPNFLLQTCFSNGQRFFDGYFWHVRIYIRIPCIEFQLRL
jgi:hypothetical protein